MLHRVCTLLIWFIVGHILECTSNADNMSRKVKSIMITNNNINMCGSAPSVSECPVARQCLGDIEEEPPVCCSQGTTCCPGSPSVAPYCCPSGTQCCDPNVSTACCGVGQVCMGGIACMDSVSRAVLQKKKSGDVL